jgi:hypothetical protein
MAGNTITQDSAHAALRQAYAAGQIVFFSDPRILARPGSPLYNPLDVFVPPLVLLASSLTLLFAFGLVEWIVVLILILFYQVYGAPRVVHWRVHRRAIAAVLQGPRTLQILWGIGGLAVALKRWPERNCIAPNGDWCGFAADYLIKDDSASGDEGG